MPPTRQPAWVGMENNGNVMFSKPKVAIQSTVIECHCISSGPSKLEQYPVRKFEGGESVLRNSVILGEPCSCKLIPPLWCGV